MRFQNISHPYPADDGLGSVGESPRGEPAKRQRSSQPTGATDVETGLDWTETDYGPAQFYSVLLWAHRDSAHAFIYILAIPRLASHFILGER